MAINYANLKKAAERLIRENGIEATLRKNVPSTGDDPWNPSKNPNDSTIKIVRIEFNAKDTDGTVIEANDRMLLVSTEDAETPEMKDKIVVGSTVYNIKSIKTYEPGDTLMLWKIHVGK